MLQKLNIFNLSFDEHELMQEFTLKTFGIFYQINTIFIVYYQTDYIRFKNMKKL